MKPEDLRYNESHEWVGSSAEDGDGVARIGITGFALEQLTDLVYMALPDVGTQLQAGQEFGEVESVKAVSPLYSPVDGEVVEVHSALIDELEKIGDDPYGNGWIVKVKLSNAEQLSQLMDHAAYVKQCADG